MPRTLYTYTSVREVIRKAGRSLKRCLFSCFRSKAETKPQDNQSQHHHPPPDRRKTESNSDGPTINQSTTRTSMLKLLRKQPRHSQQQQQSSPSYSTILTPYNQSIPPPQRAPINGGNTCYLDALLVAMFAENDGWDGLLDDNSSSATTSTVPTPLRLNLISIANDLRTSRIVSPQSLNKLRDSLIKYAGWYPGRGQHDAAELFAVFLDTLHAPFVPLVKNLDHRALPDNDADHTPFTERILWLNLYNDSDNRLAQMADNYFFGEVLHGLRRPSHSSAAEATGFTTSIGKVAIVEAKVNRSLIPAYTPVRETGETTSVSRDTLAYLTVPFAISRFSVDGMRKDTRRVIVSTALPATKYVSTFGAGMQHTLILHSVICHIGTSIRSGHYVAYTYSATAGWRRWDDLDDGPVRSARGNTKTGEPMIKSWAEEIRRNCYLLFYEIVPGDSVDADGSLNSEKEKHKQKRQKSREDAERIASDAILAQRYQREEDQKEEDQREETRKLAAAVRSRSEASSSSQFVPPNQYVLAGGGGGGGGGNDANKNLRHHAHRRDIYGRSSEEKDERKQPHRQRRTVHNKDQCCGEVYVDGAEYEDGAGRKSSVRRIDNKLMSSTSHKGGGGRDSGRSGSLPKSRGNDRKNGRRDEKCDCRRCNKR